MPDPSGCGTILVVDDDPAVIGLATDALGHAGHRVLVSLDGARAVSIAHEAAPDLVLLDAMMPDPDGFETLRRLRTLPGASTRPVIFVTGLGDTDHVVRGLGLGAVDYLTKPVDPRAMLARIAVHLAASRAARSTRAALELAGHALFAVDATGAIRWSTDAAARLLAPFEAGLPELARTLLVDGEGDDEITIQVGAEGGAALIARIGRLGDNEILLRIAPSRPSSDERILRERLRITAREAEVLTWLARGKTNRDIADVLGLSPRTVNKHLEGIYIKLGVENRSAAVAHCFRALRRG